MAKKYVYYFGDGKAEGTSNMKELLGGKGAGLAEMTNLGISWSRPDLRFLPKPASSITGLASNTLTACGMPQSAGAQTRGTFDGDRLPT